MTATGFGRRAVLLSLAATVSACAAPRPTLVRRPRVALLTPLGTIVIEVRNDVAPLSGGDFLRYVDAGKYAGARFFRAVREDNDLSDQKISVIQAVTAPGVESFPPIAHEDTRQTGLRHVAGTVSLARGALGTASGATFFICADASPALDYGGGRHPDGLGFAAFGQVTAGMDIVRAIQQRRTNGASQSPVMAGQILDQPIAITRAVRV